MSHASAHKPDRIIVPLAAMDLRDHFAAMAMQAMMTSELYSISSNEQLSGWAYETADAMLAERNKP